LNKKARDKIFKLASYADNFGESEMRPLRFIEKVSYKNFKDVTCETTIFHILAHS